MTKLTTCFKKESLFFISIFVIIVSNTSTAYCDEDGTIIKMVNYSKLHILKL